MSKKSLHTTLDRLERDAAIYRQIQQSTADDLRFHTVYCNPVRHHILCAFLDAVDKAGEVGGVR